MRTWTNDINQSLVHRGGATLQLTGSVGRRGQNRPDDVMIVQRLINARLPVPLASLDVDGICGAETIFAIETYQRNNLEMDPPDGRVDPGGATIRSLTGGTLGHAPVRIPASGPIAIS